MSNNPELQTKITGEKDKKIEKKFITKKEYSKLVKAVTASDLTYYFDFNFEFLHDEKTYTFNCSLYCLHCNSSKIEFCASNNDFMFTRCKVLDVFEYSEFYTKLLQIIEDIKTFVFDNFFGNAEAEAENFE